MDVVLLGLGESVGSGVARLLQALRILKLLRLVRLSRIMRRLVARSSIDLSLLELLKFGTLTLLMAHWLACLWGFAGNNFSDNEVRGHAKRRRVLRLIASLSACAVCPTSSILLCPSELLSSLISHLSSLLSPLSSLSLSRARHHRLRRLPRSRSSSARGTCPTTTPNPGCRSTSSRTRRRRSCTASRSTSR
jgi:hypothetical protein